MHDRQANLCYNGHIHEDTRHAVHKSDMENTREAQTAMGHTTDSTLGRRTASDSEPRAAARPGRGLGRSSALTDEQRAQWRDWLLAMLLRAGFAVANPRTGETRIFMSDLVAHLEEQGVPVSDVNLWNYTRDGVQPSPDKATRLARGLGLTLASVWYRAHLIPHETWLEMLGPFAYAIVTPDEIQADLAQIADLPDEHVGYRRVYLQRQLALSEQLRAEMTPEEFDTLRAELAHPLGREIVRREAIGDATPIAPPLTTATTLPDDVTVVERPSPAANQPGPRRPSSRRRNTPAPNGSR